MLDLKKIRREPDWFKEKLATRGVKPEAIDEVLTLDAKRRELLQETEALKAQRNEASKRSGSQAQPRIGRRSDCGNAKDRGQIKALDEQVAQNDEVLFDKLAHLPNVPHEGFRSPDRRWRQRNA